MEIFEKDAPCLCKEGWQDETERTEATAKLKFSQKLLYQWLRWRKSCFPYPVMYTDGTVSKQESDKIGRTPLGVIFENHLITMKISSDKMTQLEAMEYCKGIKLLGRECEAGSIAFWNKCLDQREKIKKIFSSLVKGQFASGIWFWTSGKGYDYFYDFSLDCYSVDRDLASKGFNLYAWPVVDMRDNYEYPVVYDDGKVSTLKSDKIGRTPLGVVFENHLISMNAYVTPMLWKDAIKYCKSIKLLGEEGELGTVEFWKKITDTKAKVLSEIFSSLGGEILTEGMYWTSIVTSYPQYWYSGEVRATNYKEWYQYNFRPVLDLSKVSSKRKKLVASL